MKMCFWKKIRDFDMSYVLGKNAYFSQEERHKQGKPFFCLGFKSFHILKCDISVQSLGATMHWTSLIVFLLITRSRD